MLDLYRPDGAQAALPTILFFYGGSWKRGSREKYAFAARALAREGYLVAVADYRTYPDVKFPAFVHDGAKAVAWLTQNAEKYGGHTDQIHMVGHSAGAHIAAMIALDDTLVLPENSEQLASALSAAGVSAHAHIYPEIGHIRLVLSLSAPFQGFASSLKDSVQFLKTGDVPEPL